MNAFKKTGQTIIERACKEVPGFHKTYDRLHKNIVISGKSTSTLINYGRCIAKLAIHFKADPLNVDDETITEYLYMLAQNKTPSESYFKHTVYGLRFLYRVFDQDDRAIRLPSLKRDKQLPVVLSKLECQELFVAPPLLKHRVLLALIYSAGLRLEEVCNLKIADIDSDRMQIHVHKGKGGKDRYVVLSLLILKGLRKYHQACKPKEFLFNGSRKGKPMSKKGVQFIMRQAVKRTGILKKASIHTLRHSFATHLLEAGGVRFSYKDYRQGGKPKTMRLEAVEFLRRFSQHILPHRFVRIRHYGLLSTRVKTTRMQQARKALGADTPDKPDTSWQEVVRLRFGVDPDCCPRCKKGKMVKVMAFAPGRAPPPQALINQVLNDRICAAS